MWNIYTIGGDLLDLRINIIQSIVSSLKGRAEDSVISIVQDVLTLELNKYEIQERCTQVTVVDNGPERMLKKFIAVKRVEGVAESTLKRYANENLKLLRFLRKPLHEIGAYDLRFYLSYRREKGKISNRSLDGMRRCYSSFFAWLTAEGYIDRNPCASVSQIKYRKKVKMPFSAIDLEKIRNQCKKIRDLALIDFLYSTGCRVSEVVRMDIVDVDFDNLECKVLGKGNKERIVYLTPVAAMHLQEYLDSRIDSNDCLFTGWMGKRIGKTGIEALVKRLGAQAGVENSHPHRFRRTLATNLLDRGMNIQDVAAILGHADLKTTQIYCYINQANVRAAYQKYAA